MPAPVSRTSGATAGPITLSCDDGPLSFRGWTVTRHGFGPANGTGAEIGLYRRAIGDWVLHLRLAPEGEVPVTQALSVTGIEAAFATIEALQDSLFRQPGPEASRPGTADGHARHVARHLSRSHFNNRFAALTAEVFAAWTDITTPA